MINQNEMGYGRVNVLDLTDVQRQPKLFTNVMMWMLMALYDSLPERGDSDFPLMAFFIDEAHLLFKEASPEFLEMTENIIRLIRSKGVAVLLSTQSVADIPDGVLGQLGNRIQHAVRAYTPKDRRAIKATVECFPETTDFNVEEALTTMPIGSALCSFLGPTGAPLPTVLVKMNTPNSRMGTITEDERNDINIFAWL
jgi:hypothetical protein